MRRLSIRLLVVAAGWAAYIAAFLLLQPSMGRGAASLATIPALIGGFLLGLTGGLAMGPVSLVVNEVLLWTAGSPISIQPTDLVYAGVTASIGGGIGWIQSLRVDLRDSAERIAESEARYRIVTSATNDVVWDWDVVENKLWWNENFERAFGYFRSRVSPSLSSWTDHVHPDDAERVVASVHAAMDDPARSSWAAEYRFRRADGSYVHVADRGKILRDAQGRATRMIGSMSDVTERHAAARALRQSEVAFRTLFENIPIGLYRTTPDGKVILANPALLRMLGYDDLESLQKRDLEDGIEATYRRDWFKHELEEGGGVITGLVSTWTTRDGREIVVREDAKLVRDDAGAPLYYEGSVKDITERVKLERAAAEQRVVLERSERLSALGTLVAGVAHEVNNPLTYIRGNVELVQMALADLRAMELPPAAREAIAPTDEQLHVVVQGLDQLASIATSLKVVARRSSGQPSREDVDKLVRSVLLVAEGRIPANAKVRTELKTTRPVHVVSEQITQVLLNLVFNSADAVRDRPDGEIVVRSYDENDAAVIEVVDNGVGISKEQQGQIFMPFHTTKPEGTGLGLSVSHAIVRDHGGTMTFRSEPGKGTAFRVVLPIAALRPPISRTAPL